MDTTPINTADQPTGQFYQNLIRSNKRIRDDRAMAIFEQAEMIYKREIEDRELELKTITRDRLNLLDLSPTSADSLTLASEFDAKEFVRKDADLGLRARNLQIRLEVLRESYTNLFKA